MKIFTLISLIAVSSALCAAAPQKTYWGKEDKKSSKEKMDEQKKEQEDNYNDEKNEMEDEYSEKKSDTEKEAEQQKRSAKDEFYR